MEPDDPIVVEAVRLKIEATNKRVSAPSAHLLRRQLPGRIRMVLRALREAGFSIFIEGKS